MPVSEKKVANATKWSSITEIIAKLIAPITSMVLARLLTPEAFGVVATINVVITFTEIFADAGFQKYLIQHEFNDEKSLNDSTTVAFWTNLGMSVFLWLVIFVLREPLAALVGCQGLGNVLAIAAFAIPIVGFSSIQTARFKREFDFKTLFYVRFAGLMVPLVVTIPLAYALRSYWALIIGTLSSNALIAIILTVKSKWKPNLFYSWKLFHEMLSFTVWTLVESVTIWLTVYIDVFIVGRLLDSYYLGLYKTGSTVVSQITGLVNGILIPVLFSSLSRLQNDKDGFKNMFFTFQRLAYIIILPMGVGVFVFRDLVTNVLLGSQWTEAAGFVGLWGLMNALSLPFSQYGGEVYRALGKPKWSTFVQIQHLLFLVPAVIIAANRGFESLYITRSLIRFELIIFNIVMLWYVAKLSPWLMFKNMIPPLAASLVMGIVGWFMLRSHPSLFMSFVFIAVCAIIYGVMILMMPGERKLLFQIKKYIKRK